MKVAVAGSSNVARYLFDEFEAHGHETVLLTRKTKQQQRTVEQRETDYSVPSLVSVLHDCQALVSTISDFQTPSAAIAIHLNMLQACQQSEVCKTLIPSEWTANVEDFPEQPMFLAESNKVLHQKFKQATDIRWTVICNSWFLDYVLPERQRYLRNIGSLWPMDYSSKVFTIYGPGTQLIDVASVRDIAKAVAILLDSKEPWDPYTYISGDQLTWNDMFAIVKKWDPDWTSRTKPLADTVRQIADKESLESVYLGHFEILSYSGASTFPKAKVEAHRSKYFKGVHFRNIEEVLTAASEYPDQIV